jgi:U3 small nucleolar RNA-associated protein 4
VSLYLEVGLALPGIFSQLTSIGPDASPIVIPLAKFGFEHQRALPFLAQEPILQSAPSQRLVASWWDREVHIWRLNKQSTAVMSEKGEEEPEANGRKLVAKILLKGEANITSAVLSTNGSLLAVATTTDIKMFLLRPKELEDGEGLRISKVVLPTSIVTGARLLQFSPDGKWLSIVRPDSHIILARISGTTSTSSGITVHSQVFKPSRLDRRVDKHILLGGLGTYDRTISQIAFSSDGTLLAVSDLAGYIDTFVLVGVEDLTQPIPEDEADAASSDNSDSESDSDEEVAKPRLIFGQHWTRNPAASLLPKLPAALVVLSFRPTQGPQKTLTNSVSPHPTRNNPNPVSHELPEGEDRLLVVTAKSDVFEFEVLKGGLTPWSRKNPTSRFPYKFRKTLDQVRGCIWDIKDSRERIWLYTVNSLWMFDLTQDFPPDPFSTAKGRKRKRALKEHPSGAGGHVEDDKLNTGISRKMQKRGGEEGDVPEEETLVRDDDAMDVDEDIEDISALQRLNRNESETDTPKAGNLNEDGTSPSWYWKTFKYRPILGIVEIGEGDEFGPEVALVERPIWEADLPPRYYGEQEWRDKEQAAL